MAMVKCPECEGKISSEAVFCPHCGYPVAEKTAITEYELETGTPESSGLSTLLSVLAWIAWIGGLILSIVSANVTKTGYYRDETVFSFPTFISLFIPFVVYGAILYGLSVMVQQIADTHGIISGLRLVRKTIEPKKAPEPVVKEKPEIKKMVLPDITVHYNGWKQVNPGVLICPRCGLSTGESFLIEKQKCPSCEYPLDTEVSQDQQKDTTHPTTDEFGWILDETPGFVRCPKCNKRASSDFMRHRPACIECGYEHRLVE